MGFILGASAAFFGFIASEDEGFRESLPTPVRIALPVLSGFAFAPLISSVGSGIATAIGVGSHTVLGSILTSQATAMGLGATVGSAIAGNKVDLKNIALALIPGAVEGKTFLGNTISPVVAQSMAIGGGISGDYKQALLSGVTAGSLEKALNGKIGQWIDSTASSFGLQDVSGLKDALLVGGSVEIYENQRQQLLDMQKAMQAEYDRLYKEEMEKARQAELAAMQAEEARLNRQQQIEEEMERQRLEFIAQEEAKAKERKRIEHPMADKVFIRRMRARSNLEEVRGLYEGLSVHIGSLAA